MERDIRAVLDGLGLLVQASKDAGKLQAMRNYAAIMALCADLRRSAEEECKGTLRNVLLCMVNLVAGTGIRRQLPALFCMV